ncbi:MAG: hypothetical protein EOO61_07170 [Hymenobacter sp.]|nr:MAG: hypothetical protein EOO61_07170 [Hymenobacter sp.]
MNIITKLLKLFGIHSEVKAQNKVFQSNEHTVDSNKIENIKPIIVAEEISYNNDLKYPLQIIREQTLGCTYKNIPRSGQGVMEDFFFDYLSRAFPSTANNAISIQIEKFSLTPDLAIIDEARRIFIAIEIDEPYTIDSAGALIPIHIIGSDNVRNKHFAALGWTVVRFAEEQIAKHPENCVQYIKDIFENQEPANLPSIECWTADDAKLMIENKHRNSYLPFAFQEERRSTTASKSSYRSFVITSLSRGIGKRHGYFTLKLLYPHYIISDGEVVSIGQHPHECLISEDDFWSRFSERILGEPLKDEHLLGLFKLFLESEILGNIKNIKIEGFGQENGFYFNFTKQNFAISFSDKFITKCRKIIEVE